MINMTKVRGTDWYTAMGWQERVHDHSIYEWYISAPSSYKAPQMKEGKIYTLGLSIFKEGKGKNTKYIVMIDHGLLAGDDPHIGTVNDETTARVLAIGFMRTYNTWTKLLNWMKKVHKIDLRTKKY